MLKQKKNKGTKPNRTSPYYNSAKKSKKNEKIHCFSISYFVIVIIF